MSITMTSQLNEKRNKTRETCKRDPLMIVTKIVHALYTDARHVHEHDVGHELADDEEDLESCTYGDIGVACLAVFEQDLVNLRKEKSMTSFRSKNYLFTCSLHSCTCCLLLRFRTSPESFHFKILSVSLHRLQLAFDISSHVFLLLSLSLRLPALSKRMNFKQT